MTTHTLRAARHESRPQGSVFPFGMGLIAAALAEPGTAQSTTSPPPPSGLVAWLPFVAGTLLIWAAFYWGFYPWARRHFDGEATKSLFFPLCMNALLTWWHLSLFYGDLRLWPDWSWRLPAMISLSFLMLLWLVFSLLRARARA